MAATITNSIYIVLDLIVIVLGLLFVMKWGKRGLLATTLWLLVVGMMCYAVGDGLYLVSEEMNAQKADSGSNNTTEASSLPVLFPDQKYEISSADVAYITAVVLWIAAFFIPVKFALFDAKKAPQGQPAPDAAQPTAPPQTQPAPAPQAPSPPPPPAQAPQAPPPAYQQAPPPQAPPPAYQQAPPLPPQAYRSPPPPGYQQAPPAQAPPPPAYQPPPGAAPQAPWSPPPYQQPRPPPRG